MKNSKVRFMFAKLVTNLRFADDIVLLASTRAQLKQMLQDLIDAAGCSGLEVHMGKTKVLSSVIHKRGQSMHLSAGTVEILPTTDSTDYLGRRFCLGSLHDCEIDSRLDKAWKKFFVWKH